MCPLAKPTLPSGTTAADLAFSAQLATFPGDDVYIGEGSYTTDPTALYFPDQDEALDTLSGDFISLGELAESPGKAESNAESLKTRNYTIPGKRTNTIEISIAGISNAQKAYLESAAFTGKEHTIVIIDRETTRAVVYSGMRWVVDWSGEVDNILTVVISTEFTGSTDGKIYIIPEIPEADEGGE